MDGSQFAVASSTGQIQLFKGSGREYTMTIATGIKDTQVCSVPRSA